MNALNLKEKDRRKSEQHQTNKTLEQQHTNKTLDHILEDMKNSCRFQILLQVATMYVSLTLCYFFMLAVFVTSDAPWTCSERKTPVAGMPDLKAEFNLFDFIK